MVVTDTYFHKLATLRKGHCINAILLNTVTWLLDMQVTEQAVQSSVSSYVSESLLVNLCTMYEALDTTGKDGLEAKSRLQNLIGPVVPDDFDLSIVKANPA